MKDLIRTFGTSSRQLELLSAGSQFRAATEILRNVPRYEDFLGAMKCLDRMRPSFPTAFLESSSTHFILRALAEAQAITRPVMALDPTMSELLAGTRSVDGVRRILDQISTGPLSSTSVAELLEKFAGNVPRQVDVVRRLLDTVRYSSRRPWENLDFDEVHAALDSIDVSGAALAIDATGDADIRTLLRDIDAKLERGFAGLPDAIRSASTDRRVWNILLLALTIFLSGMIQEAGSDAWKALRDRAAHWVSAEAGNEATREKPAAQEIDSWRQVSINRLSVYNSPKGKFAIANLPRGNIVLVGERRKRWSCVF